jgi:Flp pilus assembly protein TadG
VKRLLRSTDGATVTELALVLPVVLLFLMGTMEAAHALGVWVTLTNEAREAARYGVAGVRDGDANLSAEIQAYSKGRLAASLDTSRLTVTPTIVPQSGSTPGTVTVVEQFPLTFATPFMQSLMGTVTVTGQAAMRAE